MALPVWIDNLVAYSLQIAVLAAAGTLLSFAFRLRLPRICLIFWQVLLFACLFLPVLQKWEHPEFIPLSTTPAAMEFQVSGSNSVAEPQPVRFPVVPTIELILVSGILMRFVWLAAGLIRLRFYLRKSEKIAELPPGTVRLMALLGVRAGFYISEEIDGPATLGIFSPAILMPQSFSHLSEACKEAVVCHELLHVRRHDWAYVILEEIVRTLFWFHPAVWWLLSRIHLAREQSVDYEVVQLTGDRQPYLDSLLEMARMQLRPGALPAPLFLKERHLVQRIALLIKEASMNRTRLTISLIGIVLLLAGTVQLASCWFPLTGAAVIVQEETSDSGNDTQPAEHTSTPSPEKPRDMVGGSKDGSAKPPPPKSPSLLKVPPPPKAPPPPKNGNISGGMIGGMPGGVAGGIIGEIPGGVVGSVPGGVVGGVVGGSSAVLVDPNQFAGSKSSRQAPKKIESKVLESRLIRRVPPVYPELAKRARIQGKVTLLVNVNEKGCVSSAEVLEGHPILNSSAVEAVKQWIYTPILLSGTPIPVTSTVTVNFDLTRKPETSSRTGSIPPGTNSGILTGVDMEVYASPEEARDPGSTVVSLDESGQVLINNRRISVENLRRELENIFSRGSNRNIFVSAPAKAVYSDVVAIIDIARRAGAEKIHLVARNTR
jgi:TonB family protein